MQIRRSALVPFPAAHMYALVDDVRSYPARFRWCAAAEVLNEEGEVQHARLTLKIGGLRTAFATRNRRVPDERIQLELIEGPVRSLTGEWRFEPLGETGSKVSLMVDFEFATGLVGAALSMGFERLVDRLVDDFVQCAYSLRAEHAL